MKKNLIYTTIILLSFAAGYIIKPSNVYKVQDIYFDGEGNQIPNDIVQLFVTSQFVQIEPGEQEILNQYFYFNK